MTETTYPADLLNASLCPATDQARQWLVLHTKSRQEKALARDLLQLGIPFYLPLVPKISLCGRRRIRSDVPLFDGYLFLFASEDERRRCLTTNRVLRSLPIVDQQSIHGNLKRLEELIQTGMPLSAGGAERRNEGRLPSESTSDAQGRAQRWEPHVFVALDLDRGGVAFAFAEGRIGHALPARPRSSERRKADPAVRASVEDDAADFTGCGDGI